MVPAPTSRTEYMDFDPHIQCYILIFCFKTGLHKLELFSDKLFINKNVGYLLYSSLIYISYQKDLLPLFPIKIHGIHTHTHTQMTVFYYVSWYMRYEAVPLYLKISHIMK